MLISCMSIHAKLGDRRESCGIRNSLLFRILSNYSYCQCFYTVSSWNYRLIIQHKYMPAFPWFCKLLSSLPSLISPLVLGFTIDQLNGKINTQRLLIPRAPPHPTTHLVPKALSASLPLTSAIKDSGYSHDLFEGARSRFAHLEKHKRFKFVVSNPF